MTSSWKCSCCGKVHDSIPNSFAFDGPITWGNRRKWPAPRGCSFRSDRCVIENKSYYVRAVLEISVSDSAELFVFGVWASLSETNFKRERKLRKNPTRLDEPPYFGWFSNRIWQYPDTLSLKCNVISRAPGLRPSLELEPTNHPLAVDQRNGITQERFLELSAQCLHSWKHPESGV
jgi:hypothetical protein